jgi:hypothetical protein
MGIPSMAIPHPQVDAEVIELLRGKIRRRHANGYKDAAVPLPWLEQLLDTMERELKNGDR